MPGLKTKIELVKFGEQPTIKALPYPASDITLSQEPPSLKHKYK